MGHTRREEREGSAAYELVQLFARIPVLLLWKRFLFLILYLADTLSQHMARWVEKSEANEVLRASAYTSKKKFRFS